MTISLLLATTGMAVTAGPAHGVAVAALTAGAVPASEAHTPRGPQPAARGTIKGWLVAPGGESAAGIGIIARLHQGGSRREAVTGADGRFTLKVPVDGRYALSFFRPSDGTEEGYARYLNSLDEFTTLVKTPRVKPGGVVDVGKVFLKRRQENGTSTIRVNLTGQLPRERDALSVVLKDSRGRYVRYGSAFDGWMDEGEDWSGEPKPGKPGNITEFAKVAAGRYRVLIPATGQSAVVKVPKGGAVTKTIAVKVPSKNGNVRVVQARGVGSLKHVSVRNRAGLTVRSHYPEESYDYEYTGGPARGRDGESVLMSRGRVKFNSLPVGSYTVYGSDSKTELVGKVTVRAGRTTTVTLKPVCGGTVTGTVRAAGKGYGANVVLKGVGSSARYELRARVSGKFVGRQIAPGRYRVIVRDADISRVRYTVGGYPDAFYGGKSLRSSRIITVKHGKTTRLSPITFR